MLFHLIGKKLNENFARDIVLYEGLSRRIEGIKLIIPGVEIFEGGYKKDDVERIVSLVGKRNILYVRNKNDFFGQEREFKPSVILFSQNHAYKHLVNLCEEKGIYCVNYSAFSALDHMPQGANLSLVRSSMVKNIINGSSK